MAYGNEHVILCVLVAATLYLFISVPQYLEEASPVTPDSPSLDEYSVPRRNLQIAAGSAMGIAALLYLYPMAQSFCARPSA